jgi:hypothetical protein
MSNKRLLYGAVELKFVGENNGRSEMGPCENLTCREDKQRIIGI